MALLIAQSYKDQQQKLFDNNVFFPEMAASALNSNNSRTHFHMPSVKGKTNHLPNKLIGCPREKLLTAPGFKPRPSDLDHQLASRQGITRVSYLWLLLHLTRKPFLSSKTGPDPTKNFRVE